MSVFALKCGKPRSFMLDISTERSTVWSITLQGRSINLNRYLHSLTQNNKLERPYIVEFRLHKTLGSKCLDVYLHNSDEPSIGRGSVVEISTI